MHTKSGSLSFCPESFLPDRENNMYIKEPQKSNKKYFLHENVQACLAGEGPELLRYRRKNILKLSFPDHRRDRHPFPSGAGLQKKASGQVFCPREGEAAKKQENTVISMDLRVTVLAAGLAKALAVWQACLWPDKRRSVSWQTISCSLMWAIPP